MPITFTVGKPKSTPNSTSNIECECTESLWTTKNFIILCGGIALGVILKQQADIDGLRRTIELMKVAKW